MRSLAGSSPTGGETKTEKPNGDEKLDKTTIDVPEYYIPYWERAQETFGINAVEMLFEIANDAVEAIEREHGPQ
jgi:hypothetical protein